MTGLPYLSAFFEPYCTGSYLVSLSVGPAIDVAQGLLSWCWPADHCSWFPLARPEQQWGQIGEAGNAGSVVSVHTAPGG